MECGDGGRRVEWDGWWGRRGRCAEAQPARQRYAASCRPRHGCHAAATEPVLVLPLLLLLLVMLMLVLLLAGWQIAVGGGGRCCGGVWRAYNLMCEVSWGDPLQGLQAHIDRYRNSPVM